ncbi:hypothetical protein [Actinoplanes rectilineatus]|uniref:hypothetical protein n=1 Tax=Actinoplanes rectilineatus TaxID=113571 RepID=UPI0005F28659|nr:hypothetical protein [Actinoplanes rectilineatus]
MKNFAIGFATLIVLAGGVALAMLDKKAGADVILSALGVNLVASALFALIFSLIAGRIQDAILQQNFREGIDEIAEKVVDKIEQLNQLFLPDATYPAINPVPDDFGVRYNRDLTENLTRSSVCYFRGTSAWFVSMRLRESVHRPQTVRIAILDPGDEQALNRRVADRVARQPDRRGDALDDGRRSLVDEILMSVVALFDCRKSIPVEIVYDGDSSVHRYEIYSDALYLSWFHGPQSAESELPQSYRFGPESFIYKTLDLDFSRRFESSPKRYRFDGGVDDDFLPRHLTELTGVEVSTDKISALREGYAEQIKNFRHFLINTRKYNK